MASAFCIDVEVALSTEAENSYHLFCACLDARWEIERSKQSIQEFHKFVSQEASTKSVIPPSFNPDNLVDVEEYLCALGCAGPVLKLQKFHFLNVPKVVRDGLQYVSDKPYGEKLRTGFLQKRPSFTKRGGGKRYCELTKDDRGNSLLLYTNDKSKYIIGAFKIGPTTVIQKLPEFENTVVLLADKRQWVLQAASQRDFLVWSAQLGEAVSQIGGNNLLSRDQKKPEAKTAEEDKNEKNNKKHTKGDQEAQSFQLQNTSLTQKIKDLENTFETTKTNIQNLRKETAELQSKHENMRLAIRKQFETENKEMIQKYELDHEALRKKIEEMHCELENKLLRESGFGGYDSLFNETFVENTNVEEEKKDENPVNAENPNGNNVLSVDDHIKFEHRHLHKHYHKHVYNHHHTHYHEERDKTISSYSQTHTLAHTITHTHTKIQIKRKFV